MKKEKESNGAEFSVLNFGLKLLVFHF